MGVLNDYANERRSGKYDPANNKFHEKTLENWPNPPKGNIKTPTSQELKDEASDQLSGDFEPVRLPETKIPPRDPEVRVINEKADSTHQWVNSVIIALIILYLLFSAQPNPVKTQVKTPDQSEKIVQDLKKQLEAAQHRVANFQPKVKKVIVPQIKRVYVAESSKWREKLCYHHGDWDACLAYKKNLPWRARVGRKDL